MSSMGSVGSRVSVDFSVEWVGPSISILGHTEADVETLFREFCQRKFPNLSISEVRERYGHEINFDNLRLWHIGENTLFRPDSIFFGGEGPIRIYGENGNHPCGRYELVKLDEKEREKMKQIWKEATSCMFIRRDEKLPSSYDTLRAVINKLAVKEESGNFNKFEKTLLGGLKELAKSFYLERVVVKLDLKDAKQ